MGDAQFEENALSSISIAPNCAAPLIAPTRPSANSLEIKLISDTEDIIGSPFPDKSGHISDCSLIVKWYLQV